MAPMVVARGWLIILLVNNLLGTSDAFGQKEGVDARLQVVRGQKAQLDRDSFDSERADNEFDNEADDFEAYEEGLDDERHKVRHEGDANGFETDGEGVEAGSQQQQLQEEESYEAARFDLLLRHRLHQTDVEERTSEGDDDEKNSDGDDSSPIEDDGAAKVKELSEEEMAQRAVEQARLEDKLARQRAAVMRSGGMNYAEAAALLEHHAPEGGHEASESGADSAKMVNTGEANLKTLSEDEKAQKALEQARLQEKLARQRAAVMRSGIAYAPAGTLLQSHPHQVSKETDTHKDTIDEGAAKFREMTDDEKAKAALEQARLQQKLARQRAAVLRSGGMNYANGAALMQDHAPVGEANRHESDVAAEQLPAKWKRLTDEEKAQKEKEQADLQQKLSRQKAAYLRGAGINYAHAGALLEARKPKGTITEEKEAQDDRARMKIMTDLEKVEHDRELARLREILRQQRQAYLRKGGMNYRHGAAFTQSVAAGNNQGRPFSSRQQKMLNEASDLRFMLEEQGLQHRNKQEEQDQEADALDMSSDGAILESMGKAARAVRKRRFAKSQSPEALSEDAAVEDASEAEWNQEDDTEDEP